MDGSYYHSSNGINTTSAPNTYPSPTAISPHHLQGSPLPQTLPPLQPPASTMQPMYGSNPHTPRTPGTPNTPSSTNNLPSYQQQTSQPGASRGLYSMPQQQSQYPPPTGYPTSGSMMPQASTAPSGPQPIAPAPAGGRAPPVLRPMPPGGIMSQQPGMSSPYPGGTLMQPQGMVGEGEQPTHVVGSQGRRGILPSAPGRPAAPTAGSGGPKSTVIPVKDADGKFPCPHCTKTYLHAKHLKRHLLRHTGDRPYMCVLCRDTFSRSDILKRHFQKCSIRRGNPTGVSHLSHPQAHVKKQQPAQKPMGQEGDLGQINGLSNMGPQDGMGHPFGIVPVSDGMNNMPPQDNHLSRSNSIGRLDNGNGPDRRGMPGQVMGSAQPYGSHDVAPSMNSQPMPGYSMPPGQNGMPMYGGSNSNQQSGLDWSQMFQAGAHNAHPLNSNSTMANPGQTQTATKTEPDDDAPRSADASPSAEASSMDAGWRLPSGLDPLYSFLSDAILDFFYPSHSHAAAPHPTALTFFSPDNIDHFLCNYMPFHSHVPILHMPTMEVSSAYLGLTAAMCCVGACYSDRVTRDDLHLMMDFLWIALARDSHILSSAADNNDSADMQAAWTDTEHFQAILIAVILSLCHGNPQQRERARHIVPLLAKQARRLGMFSVPRTTSLYSPLHQTTFDPALFHASHFDMALWLEQEKRVRVVLGIYVVDSALALYSNAPSLIHPTELNIPLPCDDEAWEAADREACLSALGLRKPEASQDKRKRRCTQPLVSSTLETLSQARTQTHTQSGDSTTVLGKLVLLHGIVGQIVRGFADGHVTFGQGDGDGEMGGGSAARDPGQAMDSPSFAALSTALDNIKADWDSSLGPMTQSLFVASVDAARGGSARDATHVYWVQLYWLARYVLNYSSTDDLQRPAEVRLAQVMRLLGSARAWVAAGGPSRGEDVRNMTSGGHDDGYPTDTGTNTITSTLDMAQVFRTSRQAEALATASGRTDMAQGGGDVEAGVGG